MPFKKKFSRFITGLIVFIFLLHSFALYYFLYWRVSWFDNVMHFLGGAWLALVTAYFVFFSKKAGSIRLPIPVFLLTAVSFAALVGVGWELFEFCVDFLTGKGAAVGFNQVGLQDTMGDLFFDLLGGLVAGLVFIRYFKKHKPEYESKT
ncbi:MAG: hypothetical protein GXP44_01885 [bacterium]|nr:hypothetical protein [bacterium]